MSTEESLLWDRLLWVGHQTVPSLQQAIPLFHDSCTSHTETTPVQAN